MSKIVVHTHAGDDSDGKIWGIEGVNILLILAGLILSVGLSMMLFRQQAHSVLVSFGVGSLPLVLWHCVDASPPTATPPFTTDATGGSPTSS